MRILSISSFHESLILCSSAMLYLINSGLILGIFSCLLLFSPGFFICKISWVYAVNELAMLFLFHPGHFDVTFDGFLDANCWSQFASLSVNSWIFVTWYTSSNHQTSYRNHNVNYRFPRDEKGLSVDLKQEISWHALGGEPCPVTIHTHTHARTHTYIYIYIYMWVCLCVCVCVFATTSPNQKDSPCMYMNCLFDSGL